MTDQKPMREPADGTIIKATELEEENGGDVDLVWYGGRWVVYAYNQGGYDSTSIDLEALRKFCLKHGIWKESDVIR